MTDMIHPTDGLPSMPEHDNTCNSNNRRDMDENSTQELVDDSSESLDQARPTGVCYMYAKFLSRFSYVICLLVFATVTVSAVVTFKLYDLPNFSDPKKGFEARGTEITSRVFSFENLQRDPDDLLVRSPSAAAENSSLIRHSRDISPASLEATSGFQFCSSLGLASWLPAMIFEGVDGTNILTVEAIKSVCRAEKRLVTSQPSYKQNCDCRSEGNGDCPAYSIGNYVAMFSNKTSCADIVEEDVIYTTNLLVLCAPYYKNASRAGIQNPDLWETVPGECSQHEFAIFAIFYNLLPLEFSRNIGSETQVSCPITAVLFPIGFYNEDALKTIFEESVQKQSGTDGITRLKAVGFGSSLKYSMFSTLLLGDGLYMGIAALVIFLLMWLYTGSLLVALAAFLNMVFSLILADFFYTVVLLRPFFPFGNTMAVILMLGIGADDTFVYMDLWKKCKSELGGQDIPRIVHETLRHASVTMSVTSFTTAAALYATAFSNIIAVKCFAVFTGTAIIMNLVLTLTLLPAVVVIQHKLTIYCCSMQIFSRSSQLKCSQFENVLQRLKLFNERLIPFLVQKLRYVWILLFLLLMTGGAVVVFYSPRFRVPSNSDFQFFVSSHYFEQYDIIYKKRFANSQETFYDSVGSVIWGVQALDNGNTWDPDDHGTLVLDDRFEFFSPDHQSWLLNFCQDIGKQTFYRAGETLRCFLEEFVEFMQRNTCVEYGEDFSPCCNQTDSTYDPPLFRLCIKKFALSRYNENLFFEKTDLKLAVIKINFQTIFPKSYIFARNDEFWMTINTWVEGKLKSAPKALQRGWFTATYRGLLFYDLQQSLATGTRNSMLITLAIASGILLLSIQNVLLTLLAMLTITSAVFITVGSLVLLGWELNIVEATIITLAVGLSVDFTLHYGVAYKLSTSKDRRQRTRYSLTTMTPSITIAAFSTFLAGVLVLPSTLLTYYELGVFLMLVMSISWVHGTFFFQSMCMTAGPQGSCADIPCPRFCECCRVGTKPAKSVQPEQNQNTQSYANVVALNVYEGGENLQDEAANGTSSNQIGSINLKPNSNPPEIQ